MDQSRSCEQILQNINSILVLSFECWVLSVETVRRITYVEWSWCKYLDYDHKSFNIFVIFGQWDWSSETMEQWSNGAIEQWSNGTDIQFFKSIIFYHFLTTVPRSPISYHWYNSPQTLCYHLNTSMPRYQFFYHWYIFLQTVCNHFHTI